MERYKYSPLRHDSLRLITLLPESTSSNIRCTIRHCSYEEAAWTYVALSYRWGDSWPTTNIIINGCAMRVAGNLHAWLQAIHEPSVISAVDEAGFFANRTFWVDAICINQDDVAERNVQVQQMWRVYSQAVCVLAWLGQPTDRLSVTFAVAQSLDELDPETFEECVPLVCDGLDSCGYFDRVWIVPEILGGENIWLMCGSMLLDWRETSISLDSGPRAREYDRSLSGCRGLIALKLQEEDARFSKGHDQFDRFINHLRALSERACTDRRDKIFAMASLTQAQHSGMRLEEPGTLVTVDYNLALIEVCIAAIADIEKVDRADLPRFTCNASSHRQALQVVTTGLGVEISELREWLHALASDEEIHLSTSTRSAGPILLDLIGDGLLLRTDSQADRAYDEHLTRIYGQNSVGGASLRHDRAWGRLSGFNRV